MINRLAAVQSSMRGRRVFWIAALAAALVLAAMAVAMSEGGGIFQIGTDVVRSDARINSMGYEVTQKRNVFSITHNGQPFVTITRGVKDIIISDPNNNNIDVMAIRPGRTGSRLNPR